MGVFLILRESGVTLSGPRGIELSKSGRLRGVHLSSSLVIGNDRVIVFNVRFESSFSRDGIVSMGGESSKLLSPSGNSRVL